MPTPDPASGMEMDPEFVRLVGDLRWHSSRGPGGPGFNAARYTLYRWHLDAVERAVRDMGTSASIRADPPLARREHPTANPEE